MQRDSLYKPARTQRTRPTTSWQSTGRPETKTKSRALPFNRLFFMRLTAFAGNLPVTGLADYLLLFAFDFSN